jgi:hypothetical protein
MKIKYGTTHRPRALHKAFRAPGFAILLSGLVPASVACGGHKASGDAPSAEPVAECVQYQTLMQRCLRRDVPLARDQLRLAKTDADRERIRAVCSANLARLAVACR